MVDGKRGEPGVGTENRARDLLAGSNAVAKNSGHRERAGPIQRFREVAGPFSEIEGGGVGRKGHCPDPLCTRAPDLGDHAYRGDRLMRRIQQELVSRGDFEVVEAVWIVRRSRLIEMAPGVTDRKAEIRSNALGQLAADVSFHD